MKTTIDAVNELEGLISRITVGSGHTALASSERVTAHKICKLISDLKSFKELEVMGIDWSKAQFNDLVSQMETNFGKCEQSYKDYKVKYQLDSPYLHGNGCTTNNRCSYNFTNELVNDIEAGGYSNKRLLEIQTAMSKPATYTQAMADNGELPSIGMECLLKNSGAWDFAIVTVRTKQYIIFTLKDGREEVRDVNYYDIKPLTPPITLIDGKAYQFELSGVDTLGFYSACYDAFIVHHSKYNVGDCINIQPLTVEVK